MRTIGTTALIEQIKREGGRMGLVPLVRDGRVFVAQETRTMGGGAGVGWFKSELTPVASIDMDHPLASVGKMRRRRHEWNRMRAYREAEQRRQAARRAVVEDKHSVYRNDLARARRQLGNDDFLRALVEVTYGGRNTRRG